MGTMRSFMRRRHDNPTHHVRERFEVRHEERTEKVQGTPGMYVLGSKLPRWFSFYAPRKETVWLEVPVWEPRCRSGAGWIELGTAMGHGHVESEGLMPTK